MATNYDVARYWARNWEAVHDKYGRSFPIDLGEPTCFACGQCWNGRYDIGANDHSEAACAKAWNKAPLQKCHLLAKQFGGNLAASNLLLLCRICHEKAPDTTSPEFMTLWALRREPWYMSIVAEYAEACVDLNTSSEEIMPFLTTHIDEIAQKVGFHLSPLNGTRVKPSSWIAAALAVKNRIESEMSHRTSHV